MKKMGVLFLLLLFMGSIVISVRAAELPTISAASAILMEKDSGRILFASGERESRPIASITKLMTALIAAECLSDLDTPVEIQTKWTGIEGTSLYLKPGEFLTPRTLLYGLLLQSGNDAAVALSGLCAGDTETFVSWMNQRAADIGMENTCFADPNGLSDEGHYSSALDMAKLTQECLKNPLVAEIAKTRSVNMEGRSLANHNKLLWQYEGCIGMKTGYTRQAGRTLVSAATRDGETLICVTLRDRDDWNDHKNLLDYGFAQYPRRIVAEAGENFGTVAVTGSLPHFVRAVLREDMVYPLAEEDVVSTEVILPDRVEAPRKKGEIAGMVRFFVKGEEIGWRYLVWEEEIGRDAVEETHSFLEKIAKGDLLGAFVPELLSPDANRMEHEEQ